MFICPLVTLISYELVAIMGRTRLIVGSDEKDCRLLRYENNSRMSYKWFSLAYHLVCVQSRLHLPNLVRLMRARDWCYLQVIFKYGELLYCFLLCLVLRFHSFYKGFHKTLSCVYLPVVCVYVPSVQTSFSFVLPLTLSVHVRSVSLPLRVGNDQSYILPS